MRRGIALGALVAVIAVIAIVVVLTMGAGKQGAAPTTSSTPTRIHTAVGAIHGRGFSASVLAGWSLSSQHSPRGADRYQLSSTGAAISTLGLPPAGTIGITIDVAPAKAPPAGSRGAPSASTLLGQAAGTPKGAVGVALGSPPRAVKIAGVDAAEEAFTYTLNGFSNVQVDVAARHQGRTYLIELDAEPSLVQESQSALELLFSRWRWS